MVKIFGWMTGCFGLAALLMACDSTTGSNGGGGLTADALVGKWTVTSVHSKGWVTDDGGNKKNVDTVETFASGGNTAEYKADKTVSISVDGFAVSGTWSIKGDSVITVTDIFGTQTASSAFVSINGKSGTFITHEVDTDQDLVVTTSATKP